MKTGATHQLQQDGFSLVILMMCRQQNGGPRLRAKRFERGISGVARRFLNALPRIDRHMDATRVKRNTRCFCHVLAGAFPDIGIGLQAMVDVQGNELHACTRITPRSTCVQKRGGITAARQGNPHNWSFGPARSNKGRTRGNALCDLVDEISRRISGLRFP